MGLIPVPVLLLGGTAEAYELAERLHRTDGLRLISSLAGRTLNPRQPAGEVRVGGFGGVDGLENYLRDQRIAAIIDATHPFAARMGWNAAAAAQRTGIPVLRLARPAWVPVPGDHWQSVEDWPQAAELLNHKPHRVLLTIGRQELAHFTGLDRCWFLIRAVDPSPLLSSFAQAEQILARGPFSLEDERRLLRHHRIDTIVCKNSGGTATDAKLTAARELGVNIIMHQRPARPPTECAASTDEAMSWVKSFMIKALA